MTRPRVLVVGGFPPAGSGIYGGVVTACVTLLESSFSDRYALTLIDSTQISNPPPGIVRRLTLAVRRICRFVWQLLRRRPDCVLLFASIGGSLVEKGLMAWIARALRVPALMFPRGGPLLDQAQQSGFSRAWIRWSFAGATTVLCQGTAWQDFAIRTLRFPRENAPLVPNWTATDRLIAIGRARFVNPNEGPVCLLFLGWLDEEKGILELLEACAGIRHEAPFVLVVAGGGKDEARAHQLVEEKGLTGLVRFVGWVHGAEREQILRDADVFVLPSWSEGLPNAMVESMAAGLAVVVSAVGNVPTAVKDGVEGLLVQPRDVPGLELALAAVVRDPMLRSALAKRGHQRALEQFSVEPAVTRLDDAIRHAVDVPRSHAGRRP